jgi:hypothetical protein
VGISSRWHILLAPRYGRLIPGTPVTLVTRNPCASDRQTVCRCRQLVYDYARFAQTCQDHASGHDRCVRPQIPGLSPGGLGPHITASGSPAGFPPVSRLPAGFFPFARLSLVFRRPAFSGSSPSAVARVPVPLRFPSGFPSASNAYGSAAAGRFRRRWSRAAGTKVTSSAAAPCLDRDRTALQICPASDRCRAPRLAGAGWTIAFTDNPVTIDDPGRPRSMPAPAVSETRSPFSASRESSACSGGGPSPAATSRAPSSLRSWAVAPL